MSILDLFSLTPAGLAIDLGTANTVVYVKGTGVVLAEPSVVAIETVDGIERVLAVGEDAKLMMGKTPENIKTVRPLRNGVISDLEVAEQMIKHFIGKALGRQGFFHVGPEIVICVPSGSTQVERRAIRDAASNAGARKVWLIDEPMAAAIGADLPVTHPVGSMVVDIGGGTTEVGVISIGGMNMSMSARVGGDSMDEAITLHVRRHHNLLIGEATAERVKKTLGAAMVDDAAAAKPTTALIKGRDIGQGRPKEIAITQVEIADALADCVGQIVQVVRSTLESTAPEIAADIIEGGIILTGGGSLLTGIDTVLALATGLPVRVADNPLNCVAIGAGRTLEDPVYQSVLHGA
ncbi:rod shape-determining protein [Novosphingobium sp. G106]|uniref:rod shape-determining protein n=1 Tax=Novosphingobium sp. G106 TaxID=2849500 RepID=UPI001C2D97ED|nr:rod shape-determining protein [Novosphingobium sp. G106]MBV1686119.1 rod shape-determining protein [Novosphingobium sp. G106]MBV1691805.1 rod shape-determining protein [Novosphingobium sp. G106]